MLKEDILQLLKAGKDAYLSGQRISAQLGVSRAAVWKAVEALRKDGYGIDSQLRLPSGAGAGRHDAGSAVRYRDPASGAESSLL